MTFFECCETVRAGGLRMIRPSAETPGQYDLCEPFENGKGWTWLDAVTAFRGLWGFGAGTACGKLI